MAKHNAQNTRIKREYFQYLKEAMRRDEASIDAVAKALSRFEEANGFKDFRKFHREQAVAFKRKLDSQIALRTGKPLARATVHSTLSALRAFFIWLAGQPGYKSKLAYGDADYFNLAEKDVRIAKAARQKPVPTLEQVHHVLATIPAGTDIERRNRALIAFTILTGARDGALASLKLKHVDLGEGVAHQDARDVRTKASKSFSTWFFPVGSDALQIVTDWCQHLRDALLWGDDDSLFPKTQIGLDEGGGFQPVGLCREHWSGAGPIRTIFKAAFEAAGLPYFNPHSFRNTLAQLGERKCKTPEAFKAWSQNLGHEQVLTTFTSYGKVPAQRQAELIRGFRYTEQDDPLLDGRVLELIREIGAN
ncbi:tyrosine-type recombinase/integrase [Parasphingopyxis lamellibrachiae]|uniref:Site-specific recombinase XerD n=1 Tax=Parasphingopyxis lamellibrachiae TaxID=680125 RepID=A0A3D9FIU9_9SPHN|nr:tyrosine-type recombinase/integrase [Parasphingopyxis lamellibrachiae]RED17715.1 site-specific recombinase XerD [Parasphingopyxis lamellibrachiae]